jgi:hypothetical protein
MRVEVLSCFAHHEASPLKVLRLALPAVTLVLVGIGCASTPQIYESLDWNPGPDFERVYKQYPVRTDTKLQWFIPYQAAPVPLLGLRPNPTGWVSFYVKRGETADNWTVRAASVLREIDSTDALGGFHGQAERLMAYKKEWNQCDTKDWTVLQQDATSILYEWKDLSCHYYDAPQWITRIVMGHTRVWSISYDIRNTTLSADERTALIENLSTAKIVVY